MNSLKEELITYLQTHKRLNLDQLYSLCGREHKKLSNSERRLREMMQPSHPSYNPRIRAERNAKGAIVGYYWTGESKPFMTTSYTMACCYSSYKFGTP